MLYRGSTSPRFAKSRNPREIYFLQDLWITAAGGEIHLVHSHIKQIHLQRPEYEEYVAVGHCVCHTICELSVNSGLIPIVIVIVIVIGCQFTS